MVNKWGAWMRWRPGTRGSQMRVVPSQYLNPNIPHPNVVPSTPNQAHSHFTSQNRAPTAWFLVFSPNKPPLALDPITPSLHLNFSIPCPNGVPSTSKLACPHFASQNQAPMAWFLVFSPNEPPLAPHPIAPSHHLNPSVPHPNRVPSTQFVGA